MKYPVLMTAITAALFIIVAGSPGATRNNTSLLEKLDQLERRLDEI